MDGDTPVNSPTPMTAAVRRALRDLSAVHLDERLFKSDHEFIGTAAWYKLKYPGFGDDACSLFEEYSNGLTYKQYRNRLKKIGGNRNVLHREEVQPAVPRPGVRVRQAHTPAGGAAAAQLPVLHGDSGQRRERQDVADGEHAHEQAGLQEWRR